MDARLAAAGRWDISCDFDGTITTCDLVQAMLDRFATPEWRVIEAEWEAGRITSRACLERQTKLLRVSQAELGAWVDRQPVDPGVRAFFDACAARGLDVRVLSDGYDWVIRRVLHRLGLGRLPVFANRLEPLDGDRWSVSFPFARGGCPAGACKCALASPRRPRLHIGDGRSDACVSDACDLVWAKSALLAERLRRGRPSVAFESFDDLRARLASFDDTSQPSGLTHLIHSLSVTSSKAFQ